ncbi:MAG TPA: hypothetical protein DEH25_00650, partial [Chloroflexi bacterium]|nr:hypothetical protein [Chloroflexota bacterium]
CIVGRVEDSGIGIPAEDQRELFSEFFRAQNAKNLEVPGTGLGLSIVKRIVNGLYGTLEFRSRVGEGTVFIFRIPVNPA